MAKVIIYLIFYRQKETEIAFFSEKSNPVPGEGAEIVKI
jgi:hypothetical protein